MRLLPVLRRNPDISTDFFRGWDDLDTEISRFFGLPSSPRTIETSWLPALEVEDTKDALLIRAEIPGMEKEDIEVSVHGDVLTLKGEKKQGNDAKEKGAVRTERYYGAFSRSFTLPSTVDPETVKAAYRNGVLELALSKREEAKPKQIKIDVK
jgi:HSP20 family protein